MTAPGGVRDLGPPRFEIVSIGTELLRLGRPDTNAAWLASRLADRGFAVAVRSAVEDDPRRIASQIRTALERSQRVLATGGLGPTEDDRTREGLALALDTVLERDATEVDRLCRHFRAHGRPCDESHLRQADRPAGTELVANPVGIAAGILWRSGERWLAALPGVPAEMRAMFPALPLPSIGDAGAGIAHRSLHIAGCTESEIDRRLAGLYASEGIEATILAVSSGVDVHVWGRGPDRPIAEERAEAFVGAARAILGRDLVGTDGVGLDRATGDLLSRLGRTVATAESCTAGLLAARLTSVAGASAWFRGGVVAYADELKSALVGVSPATLARHGAVSEETARELARGVRVRCGADHGIGVTGIAGPGGGTPEKPVGLVHVAWSMHDGEEARELRLRGDRSEIRERAVARALDGLRRRLLDEAAEGGGD